MARHLRVDVCACGHTRTAHLTRTHPGDGPCSPCGLTGCTRFRSIYSMAPRAAEFGWMLTGALLSLGGCAVAVSALLMGFPYLGILPLGAGLWLCVKAGQRSEFARMNADHLRTRRRHLERRARDEGLAALARAVREHPAGRARLPLPPQRTERVEQLITYEVANLDRELAELLTEETP